MKKQALSSLGDLQRTVMELVWELGEASVHQVIERLARKQKPAYTTILSVMQKLERAGWLTHREEGRTYVYQPVQSRKDASIRSIRLLKGRLFEGDSRAFFQHLLEDETVTEEDLAVFRRMIAQRKRELRHD